VALRLKAIKESEWAEEIAEGLETVRVAVQPAAVEHMVKIGDFRKWLAREGGTPADRMRRNRVRKILGSSGR
jgi:hypothetical protein